MTPCTVQDVTVRMFTAVRPSDVSANECTVLVGVRHKEREIAMCKDGRKIQVRAVRRRFLERSNWMKLVSSRPDGGHECDLKTSSPVKVHHDVS